MLARHNLSGESKERLEKKKLAFTLIARVKRMYVWVMMFTATLYV